MDEPKHAPPEQALWRFSLAFYALPGVAEALVGLQDRGGFDVNLILFALWLGISGRGRLDRAALAAAAQATQVIQKDIVEPLRMLRRRLKHHPEKDVQLLRDGVKALELAAEKGAQMRLARLAGRSGDLAVEARLADARANLALYLGPEPARGGEAAIILEALASFGPSWPARPSA
jgi:uncharacterized protein (TIGR02444 family)